MYTSSDGKNWTNVANGITSICCCEVIENRVFVLPNGHTTLYYSDNLTTWQTATLPKSAIWSGIAHNSKGYVLQAWSFGIYYSSTGISNFTQKLSTDRQTGRVGANEEIFIALGSSESEYYYSYDGSSWTKVSFSSSMLEDRILTYEDMIFIYGETSARYSENIYQYTYSLQNGDGVEMTTFTP